MDRETITVVSGLPRSGTSMMMQILESGGMEVLTDRIRERDQDNPKGYYELECVKRLSREQSCLENAGGKAVKIISELLKHLPPRHFYKIIFMLRNMKEVLASQKQMLLRNNKPVDGISDEQLGALFERHLETSKNWLAGQSNVDVIYINYNDIIANPAACIGKIVQFLGNGLDSEKMMTQVDRTLYRQRT